MNGAHSGLGQRKGVEGLPLALEEVATSALMVALAVFLMAETHRPGVRMLAMGGLVWAIYPLVAGRD